MAEAENGKYIKILSNNYRLCKYVYVKLAR